jgi:hypothetical protein
LKNPSAISASLNVFRSAARRALISASSPRPGDTAPASISATRKKVENNRMITALIGGPTVL